MARGKDQDDPSRDSPRYIGGVRKVTKNHRGLEVVRGEGILEEKADWMTREAAEV